MSMFQDVNASDSHHTRGRLWSIDILRGVVMIIMTLDHTRDFFSNAHFKPTDLEQTTPALFLTRWITHFCAPVFVFLAGTSAFLWAFQRGSEASVSRFLAKRGIILLALTLTVEAWAWNFRNDFRHIDGGVLWAIAWSMLIMAGLVRLPLRWIVMVGALMTLSHNAFDTIKPEQLGWFGPFWAILHTGDDVVLSENWSINPYYPLVPWIGVMALGYGFGHLITQSRWRQPRRLFMMAAGLIAGFVILRFTNVYGDPDPWKTYPDPVFTLLSFINCHKYPPSLLYLMMTLGPALAVIAWLERYSGPRYSVLRLFGRTPLFFYLIHLYLIHLLALLVAAIDGGPVAALLSGGIWSPDLPKDYGYGLPFVYGMWVVVVLLLYPLCRGFETLKTRKPHWRWLSYL